MNGKYLVLVTLFFMSQSMLAGVVTGTLDKSEGTNDEQFNYTLSIQGKLTGQPEFPKVPGLEVVGTQTSQQTRIINGRYSRELQLIFTLHADSSGTFKIPAIELMVDDRIEKTLPLTLKVRELTMAERKSRPLYATQTTSRRILYQGETANLKVRLYSRYNLEQSPEFRSPSSPNLRFEELEKKPVEKRDIDGKQYLVSESSFLMVPDKPGSIVVPPSQGIAHLSSGRGFFSRIQTEIVNTNEVNIQVKPLPLKGRSKDFSGLVGQFIISTDVPKKEVKTGENVVVSFRVEGFGEAKSMAEPKLSFSDDKGLKVYKDKAVNESELRQGQYYSRKIFNYAIVPNKVGELALGRVRVQYFDPKEGRYKNLFADLGKLKVAKGKEQTVSLQESPTFPSGVVEKKEVKILGHDILGLHPKNRLSSNSILSGMQFYLGMGLFVLALILPLLTQLWKRSLSNDDKRERRRRYTSAMKIFKKAQKDIEPIISENPSRGMMLIQDQLRIYLGHKLNVHGLSITENDVEVQLANRGVPRETVSKAIQLFRDLDRARYANQVPDDPHRFLNRTVDLVSNLEKQC